MRYLRKETTFIQDGNILIPECISRISEFNKGKLWMAYIFATPTSIVVSATPTSITADAVATVNEANVFSLPQAVMRNSPLESVKAVTLYLIDQNTIEIYPATLDSTQHQHNEPPPLHLKLADDFFIIENKHEITRVRLSDIYYFEKIKGTHNTCIVYAGGIATFKQDLRDVLAGLDGAFVQCHKAFIANMTNVERIEKHPSFYVLHFPFNHNCPCSILYRKAVTKWKY